MLSILKILKKHQDEKKEKDSVGNPAVSGGATPIGAPPGAVDLTQSAIDNVSIFSVVNKDLSQEKFERVKELYNQLLDWARKVYKLEFVLAADFKKQFSEIIEKELAAINSDSQELLQLCLADYVNNEDALCHHVVNVSILSLEMGRGLGYQKQQLLELGVASFMHDIGSIKYLELINKSGKLTDEEFRKVKDHPLNGLEILSKIGGEFIPGLIDVISQEHERLDGSGYPKGLRGDEIKEYAQIVGLVDVYEAMTHLRPYRLRFSPPKTMNTILNKKNAFSTKVLKVFLEKIGIFPVGTMVRLNTKEVGAVYQENQGLPLRPKVLVTIDENGNKLVSPKQIDLSSNLLVCIEECLDVSGDKAA
ncbi:MAG: HD domain-containing protein [Candidatus Omnitrophica bacterium]|nr:HD domain-containing protein [Candidatus Omnitrophota bacterium]